MKTALKTYWPYGLLTAAIMLPLLLPGYILTLDAVFVPHLPAPDSVTSDYLWQWLLHLLNVVVPSQIIEKAIFVGILLVAAIGAHRLFHGLRRAARLGAPASSRAKQAMSERRGWRVALRQVQNEPLAPYVAGTLYAVNPFTYDRFMAGQYGVLMGYALLPVAVQVWLRFSSQPGRRELVRVLLVTTGISIVSLPTMGEVLLIALCVLTAAAWRYRRQTARLRQLLLHSLAVAGIFVILSSYWLVPAALGEGRAAQQVHSFTAAHTAAFATAGSNPVAKVFNVLQLQGFWAEPRQLYTLPQDQLPGWGTVRLAVWALVVAGVVTFWRYSRRLAAVFLAMGGTSALLAAGAFAPLLTRIGYREPQKFVGLLALTFAVLAAFGAARLFARARQRSDARYMAAASATLLVLLLFTPTMYWGFAGQLRPRQYPPDWFTANAYLNRQRGDFNTVFLPWHQYMSFDFAGRRIIATPAPRFFDRPIIASNNPELGKIAPPKGEIATRIGDIVLPGRKPQDLAVQLSPHNVRYVLLAKEYDYRRYGYLEEQKDMRLIRDTPSLRLYENAAWKGGR
jgi:hypothetical protein